MKNDLITVCSSVYPDLKILVGCVYMCVCSCVSLPDHIFHLTSSEECFQITLDMMCCML